MGCDIHCFAEVQDDKGTWHFYEEIDIDRNYLVFGYIAGVRGVDNQQYNVRGLPVNPSFMIEKWVESWDGDGHTHSWLNSTEVADTISKYPRFAGSSLLFGNHWGLFHVCRDEYPEWIKDFRFVFWFDN